MPRRAGPPILRGMTRLAPGLLALVLAGTAACSGGGLGSSFREPGITLEQVTLRGVGLTGGSLDLGIRVDNPNGVDLRGAGLRLGFDVENAHVGDGELPDTYLIPANGTGTITVPVRFTWSGLAGAARNALGYGELPYRMTGEARFTTPLGRASVPFERTGRVPLAKAAGLIIPR